MNDNLLSRLFCPRRIYILRAPALQEIEGDFSCVNEFRSVRAVMRLSGPHPARGKDARETGEIRIVPNLWRDGSTQEVVDQFSHSKRSDHTDAKLYFTSSTRQRD
jgi:hypothetical protein